MLPAVEWINLNQTPDCEVIVFPRTTNEVLHLVCVMYHRGLILTYGIRDFFGALAQAVGEVGGSDAGPGGGDSFVITAGLFGHGLFRHVLWFGLRFEVFVVRGAGVCLRNRVGR